MTVWLLISVMGILVALGLLVALVVWRKRKIGMVEEPNYRAFFIMGIAFIPVGFIWMTIAFTINAALFPTGLPLLSLGIIYLSIGLGNRDKWKKS